MAKLILAYDVRSRGAECYIRLAKEILDHEQKTWKIREERSVKGSQPCCLHRPTAQPPVEITHSGEEVAQLPIELIEPNPLQPRRVFHQDRIEELAQSIRANGIIQPLVVRRHAERYQLVAGERRWRCPPRSPV